MNYARKKKEKRHYKTEIKYEFKINIIFSVHGIVHDYRRLKEIMHETKSGSYVLRFEYEMFTIFLFRRMDYVRVNRVNLRQNHSQ